MTRDEAQERIWLLTKAQDEIFERILELNHMAIDIRNEKGQILKQYPSLTMRERYEN